MLEISRLCLFLLRFLKQQKWTSDYQLSYAPIVFRANEKTTTTLRLSIRKQWLNILPTWFYSEEILQYWTLFSGIDLEGCCLQNVTCALWKTLCCDILFLENFQRQNWCVVSEYERIRPELVVFSFAHANLRICIYRSWLSLAFHSLNSDFQHVVGYISYRYGGPDAVFKGSEVRREDTDGFTKQSKFAWCV